MRGGRMIVNPVRYGSGGKVKQATIHVPVSTTYYISGGEQKKATTSGDYLMDVGSIFAVKRDFNSVPKINNATLLTSASYLSVWRVNDA